jgi:sigma-54 specific flagellar transcriptional regulator A
MTHFDSQADTMIVGHSAATQAMKKMLSLAANKDASVLLEGPTGAGKDVAARALHDQSSRASGPFIAVNCGALPEHLVVSELFGFEKGAFTGAVVARAGKFEQADGGTIFLDEIGEMPLAAQSSLLRILETREVERIGGRHPIKVNVRLICATNRDLEARVEAGQFRADLFYRINVFPVRIPALNERPDDVRGLIDFFTRRHAMGDAPEFSEHDLNTLTHYAWPGNIRELRNLVERACVIYAGEAVDLPTLHPSIYRRSTDSELPAEAPVEEETDAVWSAAGCPAPVSDKVIEGIHFPPRLRALPPGQNDAQWMEPERLAGSLLTMLEGIDMPIYIKALERALIDRAIDRCNGSVSGAARVLRTNRTTIIAKIKRSA